MRHHHPVLIIGTGIGGLTLALALHRRGIACQLVDAAPRLQEIGAGINLLPHAVAVLADLGLEPRLAETGIATRELRFYSRHGQLIHAQPRGLAAGHAWPQYSIHRATLQAILLNAVIDRLGQGSLHLGNRCTGLRQTTASVTAELVDAVTRRPLPAMHGEAAVGCDGIHSVVRAQLLDAEDPPRYSGIAMWRGVARAPEFLGGNTMVLAGSLAVGKIVVYPIRRPDHDGGEPLTNWVAEKRDTRMSAQDWDASADPSELAWLERDWNIDGLDVPALVRRTETILRYPMVDKDPLSFWTRGRVTLLGDAAHPMYPFGSNGAGQAIVDAAVLAQCLGQSDDIAHAFESYQQIRLPVTEEIVLLNRRCSPDSILDEVDHRTGGRPFATIDDVMPLAERNEILQRYARLTSQRDVLRLQPARTAVEPTEPRHLHSRPA